MVDFRLILAVDAEGHRLGELELRATVESQELLACESELDQQHGSRWRARVIHRGFHHLVDTWVVGEQRHVEIGCLLCLPVEPQARGDLRHVDEFFSAHLITSSGIPNDSQYNLDTMIIRNGWIDWKM